MRNFSSFDIIPMLNGKYRDRYLYPRVQVKVINEQIFIIGIGHGVAPVLQLTEKIKTLDFGDITFEILDKDYEENKNVFEFNKDTIEYSFLTPWAALNKNSFKTYKNLESKDKANYLNKLLGKNLAFISNELNLNPPDEFMSKIKVKSIESSPIDDKWGGFEGNFISNINLPNLIGLGNGITRGFGTLLNLDSSQLTDLDTLGFTKLDENEYFESDSLKIDINDFKLNINEKKRKHRSRRKKTHRSKRINKDNHISNKKNNDEPNFNTELYHQKQHKV